ncbi:putative ferritin-1 [Haemophilus influenzae]|uniref:non-heme ferritin n=1 Tax=Haemophilus influenzae TaxID=727 RepID=UPI0005BEAC50|nr:non-heme ferritin [Haemophilus influenzae]AJO87322.1 putative ferritin-1 [Haemophilus influenzae]PRI67985.1 putative ferritin-1 [Haemophilus influenzae]PRJ90986.1 putative ferritin-1 [Haemophilus influenzae]PRJ92702.1 putative ferritin-1 [Haemophilus influenzae]PRK27134.1 putative ferritin-1 [Haemophilus influenzae]
MLSENVVKLLNDQMNLEFYSSNLYLQMSAWCDQQGFEGTAKFLSVHATEEMQHMRKLFTYLNETGSRAIISAIEAPAHEYKSLKEVIETTYEHEKLITSKINELVGKTFEEKDYSAFNFLQWYVEEQHEEEKLFSSILDKLNLLGEDGKSLFLIDKDLGNLATEA